MLIGTLSAPDYACGCATRIKASMRTVAFVCVTKLSVDFGGLLAMVMGISVNGGKR